MVGIKILSWYLYIPIIPCLVSVLYDLPFLDPISLLVEVCDPP